MRSSLLTLILIIGIAWNPTEAMATCYTVSETGHSYCLAPIQSFYLDRDFLYIRQKGDLSGVSCLLVANVLWSFNKSDPQFNERYAALLTATATGQVVTIRSQNNSGGVPCEVNYITIEN